MAVCSIRAVVRGEGRRDLRKPSAWRPAPWDWSSQGAHCRGRSCCCALFAPLVPPYSPLTSMSRDAARPSAAHLAWHRRTWTRYVSRAIIDAAPLSMKSLLVAAGVGLLVGTVIGLVAAYFGGWRRPGALMRLMETAFFFPPRSLLAVVLMASLGTTILNAMSRHRDHFIPGFARLARAATGRAPPAIHRCGPPVGMGHSRINSAKSCPTYSHP